MRKKILLVILVLIVVIILSQSIVFNNLFRHDNIIRIRATTTTSLYVTGLLDFLADKFHEKYLNVYIDFIPVGSGEALRRAADGDACLVLVHAPSLEVKYISQGVLIYGKIFAYNYFIIAGPHDDPANIRNAVSVYEAFIKIYYGCEEGKTVFVSRGDNSGTHIKEMSIWAGIKLDPRGRSWYIETGSDMAKTLLIANEKKGYVLTDVGTFLKLKKEGRIPNIDILYTNDTELINIYSIYLTNSCKGEEERYAREFIYFVTSSQGQELIGSFGVEEYGQPLFYPAVNKLEWLKEIWENIATKS